MGVIHNNKSRERRNKMDDTTNNAVITKDKQSSIEVSRNAKGLCAFKVKTYYDADTQDAAEVTKLNQDIMNDLIKRFE